MPGSIDRSHIGSQYTDDQIREACLLFAIEGTLSGVSRKLNIPVTTVCDWTRKDWWKSLELSIRKERKAINHAK